MLIRPVDEITKISDNEEINQDNYLESISFIDNLYFVINKLSKIVGPRSLTFLPTFKGQYICQKYNIMSLPEENEMRLFEINSPSFLEDDVKQDIQKEFDTALYLEFEDEKMKVII